MDWRELVADAEENDRARILVDYVRKEDIAKEFEVSTRTIERWVRLRLLPAPVRLGKTSLHHLPTVREHLKSLTNTAARRRGR